MAKPVLAQAGFAGEALNTALGVSYAESGGYADAVGDLTQLADPVVAAKWGPSIGLFQIRSLRDPTSGNLADTWRVAEKLRDPLFNARAAYAISKQGTDWSPWSVFRHSTYIPYIGRDYPILLGHERAHLWNS